MNLLQYCKNYRLQQKKLQQSQITFDNEISINYHRKVTGTTKKSWFSLQMEIET